MRAWIGSLTMLVVLGCSAAQPAPRGAESSAPNPATSAPDAGPADTGTTDAGVAEVIPLDAYRATFVRELMRLTRSREVPLAAGETVHRDGAPVPHSIEVLKRIGQADAYLVTSIGFGRIGHGNQKRGHVELLAYVEEYGPKIAEVLEALGDAMHAGGEHIEAWKEYSAVELPAPKYGMQYFDLRPAGEVDITRDLRVMLLKVIPMSADEYERTQENPAGEWDDPNAAARAVQRWKRLVERK
jgi:hypothetical protein